MCSRCGEEREAFRADLAPQGQCPTPPGRVVSHHACAREVMA
jgi:hypothetical protein